MAPARILRRREQGTVRGAKLRPRDLAAEDVELVAQDEQLDVLDVQATATANDCAQKSHEREVEKREGHGRRSSQPSRRRGATRILAPFTPSSCMRRSRKLGPSRNASNRARAASRRNLVRCSGGDRRADQRGKIDLRLGDRPRSVAVVVEAPSRAGWDPGAQVVDHASNLRAAKPHPRTPLDLPLPGQRGRGGRDGEIAQVLDDSLSGMPSRHSRYEEVLPGSQRRASRTGAGVIRPSPSTAANACARPSIWK
jgi:hypothetical protein